MQLLLNKYVYICTRLVSHYKAKGIIDPCNEIEVRPDGFARVFLLLNLQNEWMD